MSTQASGRTPDFRVALHHDTAPRLASEIAELLRTRLRIVAVLFLLDAVIFVVRDLLQGNTFGWTLGSVNGLVYLTATLILFSSVSLSLRRLRGLELATIGMFALSIAAYYYRDVYQWTLDGNGTLEPGQAEALSFPFFVAVTCYAMFIPAGWRRALAVSVPLAAIPFVILAAVRVRAMQQAGVALQLNSLQRTNLAAIFVFEIMIAVIGAYAIHSLRTKAFEAKRLGHYRLKDKIGRGGMGEVWEAEHHLLASPAAIKLIRPDMVGEGSTPAAQATFRRFEREAKATASLRSPHTVAVHDFGIAEDGTFYYVMELLPGLDLDRLVRRFGPVSPGRAAYLLRQVCDSLAEAHDHGLIHRDVKPANIFTCHLGRSYDFVKLVDFGLVKSHKVASDDETALTLAGSIAGTPAYMAPEAILGKVEADPRADIYAVGCVGYWLLTGRTVFEEDGAMALAVAHVRTPAQPPSASSEQRIPATLDDLILACLEKNPEDRPQSVAEVRRRLDGCLPPDEVGWDESHAEAWWATHGAGPQVEA